MGCFLKLIIIPGFIMCQRITLRAPEKLLHALLVTHPHAGGQACLRQAGVSKADYTDFLPGRLEAEKRPPIENGAPEDKKGVLLC
jgi:hypothetical protein